LNLKRCERRVYRPAGSIEQRQEGRKAHNVFRNSSYFTPGKIKYICILLSWAFAICFHKFGDLGRAMLF
jgi:hypothetical protein